MGRSSDDSSLKANRISIIIMIIIIVILSLTTQSYHRYEAHMVYIGDGYCYNEDSKLIYIESTGYSYSYTLYIDKDGHNARYNEETGEWEVAILNN